MEVLYLALKEQMLFMCTKSDIHEICAITDINVSYRYINDVTSHAESCELAMYVDDSNLFKEMTSVTDCQPMQKDLDNVFFGVIRATLNSTL